MSSGIIAGCSGTTASTPAVLPLGTAVLPLGDPFARRDKPEMGPPPKFQGQGMEIKCVCAKLIPPKPFHYGSPLNSTAYLRLTNKENPRRHRASVPWRVPNRLVPLIYII